MQIAEQSYFFPCQRVSLNAMMCNCGHEKITETSYRHHGLWRGNGPLVIWQYTLSGRGAIELAGQKHDLVQGQAFLVVIPSDHIYFLPKDSSSWEFIYINLFGSEIKRLADQVIEQYGNILNFSPVSQPVQAVQNRLQGKNEKSLTQYDISGFAYLFMLSIFFELERVQQRTPAERLMQQVNDFLGRHIDEALTVGQMAEAVGLSRPYFSNLFRRVAGQAPQQYLAATRLLYAEQLLKTETSSIKEIAVRSGFTDSNYFCRVFRKAYGVSPKAYRNQNLQ